MENPQFIFTSEPIELKEEDKNFFVEGYVSTSDLDLVNDIVTQNCILDMANQMKSRSIKLDVEHESFRGLTDVEREINKTIIPVAKVDDFLVDKKGLKIRGILNKHSKRFDEVKGSIKDGFLDAFSIAYVPTQTKLENKNGSDIRLLDKINLLNIAFTGNPVNTQATMTTVFAKSLEFLNEQEKARGEGQGVGGERQGDGGPDYCYCTKCDYKVKHTQNKPCTSMKCPKCGGKMTGVKPEGKSESKKKHSAKWHRCVNKVRKIGGVSSPEAVCTAALEEESYKSYDQINNLNLKEVKKMSEEEKETEDKPESSPEKPVEEPKEELKKEPEVEKPEEPKDSETKARLDKVENEVLEVKAALKKPVLKSKIEQQDKSENFIEEKSLNPLDIIA